jgi:hypothetical protein
MKLVHYRTAERTQTPAPNDCHPEQREGPGFLPTPANVMAQARTQVPRARSG